MLIFASLATVAVGSAKAGAEEIIGFNAGVPSHTRLVDHRTGKRYIVALEPDPDVHGTIDVVDLILTRESGGDQNLLAPFGIYHGLQPYNLAALDFKAGADKSTFGRVRRIPIRRTATKLVVTIEGARVREVAGVPVGQGGSEEITSVRATVALDEGGQASRSD